MINKIIKPFLLVAKLNHLSNDELSLKLERGIGVFIINLIILILIPIYIYFFFENYEITCQSKEKNSANGCVLQVKHFIFSNKKTVHLGQLKEARTDSNYISRVRGGVTMVSNILLETNIGVVPLFSSPRSENFYGYFIHRRISKSINKYIKESKDSNLKIDDPNGWFIYFLYFAFLLFSILTLYKFLDSIYFLLNKNKHQLILNIKKGFRIKEAQYALPDIDKFVLREKGDNVFFGLMRNLLKSEEVEEPIEIDILKLKYKTFMMKYIPLKCLKYKTYKMKHMPLKSNNSGDEYNSNKESLFAIYLVLKTGYLIQLTSFHYVDRKKLLNAIEELNKFLR